MASVTDAVKGVFVGLNDNINNAAMDGEVKVALTATIGQLFVMIDMIAGLMANFGAMANEKQRLEMDIKNVMHSTGMVQGAVETLVKQQEAKRDGGGGRHDRNVLESSLWLT